MGRYPLLFLIIGVLALFVGELLRVTWVDGTAVSFTEPTSHIPIGNPEGWQIQTISTRGDTGRFTDLVLDANGYPHVSFIEQVPFLSGVDQQLHYAYWDGVRWHQEMVVQDLFITDSFDYTAIDLDTNGRPHIIYLDNSDLHHAFWNGSAWQTEAVEDSIANITQPSFQLDSNNRPHISYLQGYDLAYTFWDGTAWQSEIVDAGLTGSFNSLALDTNNHPHISYIDIEADILKYAAYDGVSWNIQTVDGSEVISGPTSLALTTSGSPRISYVADSGNLKYARWSGKNWQTETVTTLPTNNVDVVLVLDTADSPHIIYSGSLMNEPLTYLYQIDGFWQTEVLDSSNYPRVYRALAVDPEGDIHASYFDGEQRDLRYVTWDPNWLTRTIEYPSAIQATSLQLSKGNPHISYYDGLTAEVKLVGWQEAWNQVPLPLNPISNQVMQTSLAFTSSKTHISYSVNGGLLYLVWDGQDWEVQLVDTSATVGDYNQVLAVADTFVRIAYWDETNFRVKLAELQLDNTWELHTNTVGPVLDANSGYLSATVLPEGNIGISYYDAIQGDLRLAVWHPDTGLWTDELIDGVVAYTGLLNALQTDGTTGFPVVAYYIASTDTIYYAYQQGEMWHTEPAVIEAGGVTSLILELGFNSRTRPQIAYTTYTAGSLYIANKQGINWNVETVVNGSSALDHVSMTLSDRPHLAYTDNGLYYAFRAATLDVETAVPGSPPVITGGPYNPLDACLWFIAELFDSDENPMTSPALAPSGEVSPMDDMTIFGGLHMLFAVSPGGDYYIDRYIQHGAEMGQIGVDDPQLLWDAHGTLQNFLPGLEALVQGHGDDQVITQEMVDDALDIWQRVSAVASPDLSATINTELARYNNLQDFVGLTFAEWLAALGAAAPDHHLYLPVVIRDQ